MVGERLDRLPISKWHHRILWLISGGLFFDCFDIWLAGAVLAALLKSGFSDIGSNSVFLSVTALGLLIGALYGGILGDHFGRKFSYTFNLVIFGLASIAAALSPNMIFLTVCRGIMGVGLGAEVVTGYTALTEFIPARVRGKWEAMATVIANASLAFSAILAVFIVPISWRYMFLVVGAGALVMWYIRKALPESPRWFESKGKFEKAEELVASIEKTVEKETGAKLPPVPPSNRTPQTKPVPYWYMFKGKLLKRSIAALMMFAGQSVAQGVFMTWLPVLLMQRGLNLVHSLAYTAIMSVGAPIGGLIGAAIIDRFSRKWLTVISAILTAAAGFCYGTQATIPGLLITGFLFFVCLFIHNAIAYTTFIAEMFPTRIRMRAYSFGNLVGGRLVSLVAPLWAAFILLRLKSPAFVFLTVFVVFMIEAIVVIFAAPETRNKNLEELEEMVEMDSEGKGKVAAAL